jgi:hypothetical protein
MLVLPHAHALIAQAQHDIPVSMRRAMALLSLSMFCHRQ